MPRMPRKKQNKSQPKKNGQSVNQNMRTQESKESLEPFSKARHLLNRSWMINKIRAEVIGPDPNKSSLPQVSKDGVYDFDSWELFNSIGKQENGEEVLIIDPPLKRYGAGILFPRESPAGEDIRNTATEQEIEDSDVEEHKSQEKNKSTNGLKEIQKIAEKSTGKDEESEEDTNFANAYRPSAIGLSLLSNLPSEMRKLHVKIKCARYQKVDARITTGTKTFARTLWLRIPYEADLMFDPNELRDTHTRRDVVVEGGHGQKEVSLPLRVSIIPRVSRSVNGTNVYSISLVHTGYESDVNQYLDGYCLFQVEMEVSSSARDIGWIHPYPEPERTKPEKEEEEIALQYRGKKNYGIGHGCSVGWNKSSTDERCSRIWTEIVPTYETHPVSPEAVDEIGENIQVSMEELTRLSSGDENSGNMQISRLIHSYATWIKKEKVRIDDTASTIDGKVVRRGLLEAAIRITEQMDNCLSRIKDGLACLFKDPDALKAFQLANRAMFLSQEKAHHGKRIPTYRNMRYIWPAAFPDNKRVGNWRSFQIAFILMCLKGICDPEHRDRKIVDLIWFATGGGKTEAYLGLIAFTIFYNRIKKRHCDGADVFMRYTLRLLTSQQFQRATLLFCAMEHIRVYEEVDECNNLLLGQEEFRIGLWVGSTTTPNTQENAVSMMKELARAPLNPENSFPVLKCPWCHAAMGPINLGGSGRSADYKFPGYEIRGSGKNRRLDFCCPDNDCMFSLYHGSRTLPVSIIDEDLYKSPPNLIISTIDKFAGIPFRPEIRKLFGLNEEGVVEPGCIPPSLIIQDELHLISGPLGTVAGLYETLIEDLCCQYDSTGERIRLPKIVASTATISRSREQIRALYARTKSQIFPPPGLDSSDSFFAHEESDKPGRVYLGILAPNHGSQQTTQARLIATVLEVTGIFPELVRKNGNIEPAVDEKNIPKPANPIERDPFWTLLLYFNSLRELGGAASLLVSDVPDYQKALTRRWSSRRTRYPQSDRNGVVELTGRIPGNEIESIMETIQNPYPGKGHKRPIDVCLATNIIEVGVDIDRLSLMGIVGQPKTTAQYIQVSSRIGRKSERPGLVLMMYQAHRPRDRSFYERFRIYHSRLYAQVEPTSVTPFSPPSTMRALHAIIVGFARMYSKGINPAPSPFSGKNNQLLQRLQNVIKNRVECVDIDEMNNVLQSMDALIRRWDKLTPQVYGDYFYKDAELPLIHQAGAEKRPEWKPAPWPTMTSMRNVDATCGGEVTSYYNDQYLEERE